ncbi:hypothetical protein AAG906_035004 [Vitis piasezkii]|uniref:Uncharacterized protein n=1 Tax=Vitis vinifera TaxID=29760 RepID=F6HZ96_VITVI
MEAQTEGGSPPKPRVKATLNLGPETYSVNASKGTISEQLVSVKEESMGILKEFITKHNVPNDVPDEPLEASSEDEDEVPENPPVTKKRK